MSALLVSFRVIWASAKKDVMSALTERSTLLQCATLPINYFILLSLFVLSGSNAPTAVVMKDTGPYAQQLYQAMSSARSFHLIRLSASQAQQTYQGGTLVAVVTIPVDFDIRIAHQQMIHIPVQINNLNTDLTDDVHRALRLSMTTFYAQAFPHRLPLVLQEQDAYAHDTDYIPFLAISILVICLMVSGLLQGGMAAAREWEKETIKELLLAPVPPWTILVGKMLGAFLVGLLPVTVVLVMLVCVVGDWPTHWLLVIAGSLLTLLVFVAGGNALGMALKQRSTLTTIIRAISVPLFFLSGIFGPLSFQTPAIQFLARLFPVHYAIVFEQFAFKSFPMSTLGLVPNGLILCAFALLFLGVAVLVTRMSTLAH